QFFPKGTDFNKVSRREIKRVQKMLNERPRAVLGYRTPKDVFEKEILNEGNAPTKNLSQIKQTVYCKPFLLRGWDWTPSANKQALH
ncbi:MAG: hypothetical protein ACK576_12270, partial [Cyclobacteriaceae bacterium]